MPSNYELLESIPDAVVVTNPDGGIVYANRKAQSMSGYKRSELIGRKVEVLVPLGTRRRHVEHRREFYHRGVARLMGKSEHDFILRRKDGTSVEVEISLGPAGNDTIAVVRDVTDRHLMEEALEHRALHDPLTDLANRTLFFDRLHQAIYSAGRDGSSFALVMLDVDGFKAVNDRYGHASGDEVLRQLSAQLRRGMRATDTAARIGGDEFAWILPRATGRPAAQRMVRKRMNAIHGQISVDRKTIEVGVSAGIAMYPDDGRDTDSLIRHADAAMYGAKRKKDRRDR